MNKEERESILVDIISCKDVVVARELLDTIKIDDEYATEILDTLKNEISKKYFSTEFFFESIREIAITFEMDKVLFELDNKLRNVNKKVIKCPECDSEILNKRTYLGCSCRKWDTNY